MTKKSTIPDRLRRQVQERARIHMIVVIMGQEDGSWFGQQRSPERRDGGLRKPGEQPGIEQQHLVPLPIQQRGMSEMDRVCILQHFEPAGPDRGGARADQAFMLMKGFDQSREHAFSISPRGRHRRVDFVGLMRTVQEPQYLSHQRPQLSLVEPDRNRLPLYGMEDPEPAVGDRGGFGGIGRKLPLKRTVRLPPTTNMLLQIGAGADHLRIGILQSPLTIRIVKRGPLGKDIADGRCARPSAV